MSATVIYALIFLALYVLLLTLIWLRIKTANRIAYAPEDNSELDASPDVLSGHDSGLGQWVSKRTPPDDSLLQHGDYGVFWCYLPNEEYEVSRYATRIYTKPHGWNDSGVSHWQRLPPAPIQES